jgi:hypothetical protein
MDRLRKVELNAPVLEVPCSVERDVVRVGSIAAKNTRNDSVETYATVHNAAEDCPLSCPPNRRAEFSLEDFDEFVVPLIVGAFSATTLNKQDLVCHRESPEC